MRSTAPPTPESADRAATREHLLAIAAEAFAQAGFRGATVREICQKAGANLAAVNYHFRDKEGLYTEVLRRNYQRALQRFPTDGGVPPHASPEDRLHGFVRSFLLRVFSGGPDSCHGRLLAREMTDPTTALDTLVAVEIKPLADFLATLVRDLAPTNLPEPQIRLCMASIVGQVAFYLHCRPVITRIFPDLDLDHANLDQLADHITRFSLAGLRALPRSAKPAPARTSTPRPKKPRSRTRPSPATP